VNGHTRLITDASLPHTFRVCDQVARKAQESHLRLVRIHIWLGLMLVSISQMVYSLCDALAKTPTSSRVPVRLWLVPLGLGACVTLGSRLLLRTRQREQIWCRSRAAAEQIRSCAWFYMMQVDPDRHAGFDDREPSWSREALIRDIESIREKWIMAVPHGISVVAEGPEVSPEMEVMRDLPFESRLRIYQATRVQDQLQYYSRRANECARKQRLFTALTELFECGAVIFAVLVMLDADELVRLIATAPIAWTVFLSPCLTAAAATLAWMSYKRYSELRSSYGTIAEQLQSLQQEYTHLAGGSPGHDRLARFVRDCESLLTVENQTWFVRRSA